MIRPALSEGIRSAARRPGLVALLWAWNLALALVAALPFWRWIAGASARWPETDVLLDRVDLGIVTQLLVADAPMLPTLLAAVAGTALLSLVSGCFLAGGILDVVMAAGDERPLLRRFFAGAGRFFGRFVRLLLIGAVGLGAAAGGVGAVFQALRRPLVQSGAEAAIFWSGLVAQLVVGLVFVFLVLALDYARVFTVAADERRMLRSFWRGLRFVARHLAGSVFIALLAGIGVAAAIAACAAYDVSFSARSWAVIIGAVLVQQAALVARTAIRVGQLAAQARYAVPRAQAPGKE